VPDDWVEDPPLLSKISEEFRPFAKSLNAIWKLLGKKLSDSVWKEPQRHSLIPVKRPFIAPGGRFREFYYWYKIWE
jgi:alpha,alpha-trehalase